MVGAAETLLVAAGGGGVTFLTQCCAAWMKSRGDRHKVDRAVDVQLEEHRDALTFQLLEAARAEVAAARLEVQQLRPLEQHLYHFQQALEHIEAMLSASEEQRLMTERNARAFLNRMRRLNDARGAPPSEVQRTETAPHVGKRVGPKEEL